MKKFAAHGPMIETGDDFTAGYYRIMEVDRKIASMNETIGSLQRQIAALKKTIAVMDAQEEERLDSAAQQIFSPPGKHR